MKNLIKQYALEMKSEDVIKYAYKEGVNITNEEANTFVTTIKENIDYILEGHAKEILENKRSSFSESTYLKLNELLNKYSKFI